MGSLELESCDPSGYIPCDEQRSFVSIALPGTGASLTYSSEWAKARLDRPAWNASPLGIDGWSLDVLERYDAPDGVLLDGDGSWRLVQPVALPSGESAIATWDGRLVYIFDASGKHVRTVDGISGTTLLNLSYDEAGLLTSVAGTRAGQAVHLVISHAQDGTPQGIASAAGAVTALGVDVAGDLSSVTSPTGAAMQLTWASGGLLASITGPTGAVTQYEYDASGRLASTKDPDGVRMTWQRTASAGSVEVSASSAGGATSTYRSEALAGSVRRTFVAPGGATTTLTEDAAGGRTVALADGTTLAIGAQPDPRWGTQAPILSPFVETRPDGATHNVEITRAADGPASGSPFGVATSTKVTADGNLWSQSWDPTGRAVIETDPLGRITRTVLDDAGRVTSISAPGRPTLSWTYDESGRIAAETVGSGTNARTTSYAYNDQSGTMTVTLPDGSVQTVTVDQTGRTVEGTNSDGATQSLVYDATGRLVQVRPPGHPAFTLGSSPAGRSTAWLPPIVPDDSSYESDSYTADGQLAAVNGPGSRSLAYSYDPAGRLAQVQYSAGAASFNYDPTTGLPATSTAPGGVSTTYGYSGGLLTTISWTGPVQGRVDSTLDPAGRLTSVSVDAGSPLSMTYDNAGALTAVGDLTITRDPSSGLIVDTVMGVVTTHDDYDDQGRVTRQVASVSGKPVLERDYTYDDMRRVATVTESNGTTPPVTDTTTYAYDDSGRLAGVTVDGVAVEKDTYDISGNRVAVTVGQGGRTATFDDRDRLLTWGDTTFSYAPDGTLLQESGPHGVTAFQYDDLGMLRAVTLPDGRSIAYIVDASGRRVGRTVDGALTAGYVYGVDGHLAAQLDASGNVVAKFGWDDLGRLASVIRDGHSYRVITDEVGDPRTIVDDATGQVVEAITYDAWGAVLSDSNPGFVPIGFAGGLRDPDTGLVLFGARDYDPAVGRWTAPDPIRFSGGDTNLYRYAGGDPVNWADPTGLDGGYISASPGGLNDWGTGALGSELGYNCAAGGLCDFGPPMPAPTPPQAPTPPAPPPAPQPTATPPQFCLGTCSTPGGSACSGLCSKGPGGSYCLGFCSKPGGSTCIGTCAATPTGGFACGGFCMTPNGPCLGYCSRGDPHMTTADGEALEFQAAGEFLVAQSPDGSVVIQARQEPPAAFPNVTYATAVAAAVAGDRVAATLGGATGTDLTVTINGTGVNGMDWSTRLPNGGIVERHATVVTIDWPGGSHLSIQRFNHTLSYGFTPDTSIAPTLSGLLGSKDGNPANDLTGRDGVVLQESDPDFFNKLYHQFGNSWRVTQAESLFDYLPGQSTATFTLTDIPHAPATADGLDSATRARAESLCRAVGVTAQPGLTDCTLDVGVTGDPSYASAAAAAAAGQGFAAPATANGRLQSITLGQVVSGNIGQPNIHDRYTFAADAGQIIYLQTYKPCVDGLLVSLLKPDGFELAHEPACLDAGREVLPQSGTYTIQVSSTGTATGAYSFTAWSVPGIATSSFTTGQIVSGSTTQVGEWRDYTMTADAGQIIYLQSTGPCIDGLQWRLIGPASFVQAEQQSCRDLGRQVLVVAGTYTVEIYSDGTAIGAYRFVVLDVPPITVSTVEVGQGAVGSISQVGEWHDFTFAGAAGQLVYLQGTGPCVDGLLWRLLGPDGTGLALQPTCRDIGSQTLGATGTFTVEIYSDGTGTGAYAFNVLVAPPASP